MLAEHENKCEGLSKKVQDREIELRKFGEWKRNLETRLVMHDASFVPEDQQTSKKRKTANEEEETDEAKSATTQELLALSRALQVPTSVQERENALSQLTSAGPLN